MTSFPPIRTPDRAGMNGLSCMAFIPARGGSKGLRRKNVIDLSGKPMLAYTIEVAVRSGCFDRVVVSTEDEEIMSVAREWGAEVPVIRPDEMAGDKSLIGESLRFTLDRLKENGYEPNICAELYPTSPFRSISLIRTLMGLLATGYREAWTALNFSLENCGYHTLAGKRPIRLQPSLPLAPRNALATIGLFHGFWMKPVQGLNPWGVYVHRVSEPACCVDIDGPEDFALAEYIITNDLFDFEVQQAQITQNIQRPSMPPADAESHLTPESIFPACCAGWKPEPCKPSPFSFRTGYVLADAGLFAFLQPGEGIRASRPFPLAWPIYNKVTQNDRPVGFIRARFQGFAAVSADSVHKDGPVTPLPGPLRYLADGPNQGRRLLSAADGPETLLGRLSAVPVSQPAHSAFLRMVQTGTSGQSNLSKLALELSPTVQRHPGVLCLYLFKRSDPTHAHSVFFRTPWMDQDDMEACFIDSHGMDYALVFLLHEASSGPVDILHPVAYGFSGLRYSAQQDSIVSAATGKMPHGRQFFPPVYRTRQCSQDNTEVVAPASWYAALCDETGANPDVRAASFVAKARDIHIRLCNLEESDAFLSIDALDTLRQEVLDALALISNHYLVMRSVELVMQYEGMPVVDDADPLPLSKVFKAYGFAMNQARFQLHDILYRRIPSLRRNTLLASVQSCGLSPRSVVDSTTKALATEPEDIIWLRIAEKTDPALLDRYVLRPTDQAWGPFQSLRVRLAGLGEGSSMICCDTEAGKVLLLKMGESPQDLLPGVWTFPSDVCADSDTALVLDTGTGIITRLDSDGRILDKEPAPSFPSREGATSILSLLRLDGESYYLFHSISSRNVWCARQEGSDVERLFKLDEDRSKFAGWAAWNHSLVFASANHAAIHIYTPEAGTWETLDLPVEYPQFMGLGVAGDFAYLNCPPFIIKYDLCQRRTVYMAHRPQLVGIYPPPWKCFHVVERKEGHALCFSDDNKLLREYIVHNTSQFRNY